MFSIIIPLYNKENVIVDTLESILSQSFEDFEIIIIDDGSTDMSVDRVASVAERRVKLYKKDNGGVSSARNFGMARAKGEWLMFLDADDKLEPNTLQHFANAISIHPTIEIFISNFFIAELDGTIKPYSNLSKERLLQNPIKYLWER